MLPPRTNSMPAALAMAPTSAVVVDLPLEPVMPMVRPGQSWRKSRIWEVIGMPSSRARARAGS
ncbi:MAG: hypothetical protein KatS3mg064_0033 [Tepidiforma sp.]|nr:hypothetical protein [Tepidiforma sp.]GIW16876.1 MAG: hypothetical protein KatS3mg064_0033 [Tepidiforma sp.]